MPSFAFAPAWFARNPHLQTVWGKFVRPHPPLTTTPRERWRTPDGDSVTVVRLEGTTPSSPRLLLLHGLEGTERSHYVESLFHAAAERGWGADLLLFRSCDGRLNDAPRFYHSGETSDVAWFIQQVAARHPSAPLFVMGVSLGGNVLVKLLGEPHMPLPETLRAAVAVSVPFDLARGSRYISQGFSRVYERWFLRTLRRKALAKRERFPTLFPSADAIAGIRTLWEFDDRITGPLHGFTGALDYYTRCSAQHFVQHARVPLLLVSAIDDPFLPADVLEEVRTLVSQNPLVETEFLPRGGHVGFVTGALPWRTRPWLVERIPLFFERQLRENRAGSGAASAPLAHARR
jgi:uncharacterized protein